MVRQEEEAREREVKLQEAERYEAERLEAQREAELERQRHQVVQVEYISIYIPGKGCSTITHDNDMCIGGGMF